MSHDETDLWSAVQEVGKYWPYPSRSDYLDVSFDAQLKIIAIMTQDSSAKSGWDRLGKYLKLIGDTENFCLELVRYVIHVRCSYAISRKEGKKDRLDRFEKLSKAVSTIKSNLLNDGELFRECRLPQGS